MSTMTDYTSRIADYIFGDMSPEEMAAFEQELKMNPELEEQYRMNVKATDYLKARIRLEEMESDPDLEEAQRLADNVEEEMPHNHHYEQWKRKYRTRKRNYALYGLLTAALIASVLVIKLFAPLTNPDKVFNTYYQPLDAVLFSERGEGTDLYLNLNEGIRNYLEGDYRKSIRMLSSLETDPRTHPEINLYTGLSMMALGDYQAAITIFESYLQKYTLYLPEVKWYLSLCYLKTRDIEKAENLLADLEQYHGIVQSQSAQLLRDLRTVRK